MRQTLRWKATYENEIRASNTTHYQSTVNSLVQILGTIFIYLIIQERLRTHLIIKARLEPSLNVGSSQRTDQGASHPRSIARAQLKPGLITNLNQNLWSVRKHSL